MIDFNKKEIKDSLTIDDIFSLLSEWGGDPEYSTHGLVSATICHNQPGEGSRKLYFYENSNLFQCYTGCEDPSFDIFELTIKVFRIQEHKNIDLNTAVRYIAYKFGINGTYTDEIEQGLEDWKLFDKYERINNLSIKDYSVTLNDYNKDILDRFNYTVKIGPWLEEGMTDEVLAAAGIGFYPGGDQITIPHFDKDGRFIGLRGRSLCLEEAERFGKYRPLKINGQLYNHPLGMNLYNLDKSKDNIKILGKAIIFEAEKSCLQYASYFGPESDISVACCGSNVSAYQINMLIEAGAKEIIIAFDKQFQSLGDTEFKRLTSKLKKIHNKYKNTVLISFIFDKKDLLDYKDSPTDKGAETFLKLFKNRVLL